MKHLNLVKGGFLIHKGELKKLSSLARPLNSMSSLKDALPSVSVGDSVRKSIKSIKPLKYKF